jgi:hypothetical protein
MAGFNAATVVLPLDWTFEPLVTAKGTVREPTDDQIVKFLTDVKALVARLHEEARQRAANTAEEPGTDLVPASTVARDPADLVDAIEELDPSVVGEFHQELAGIFAELCSDSPSRETLLSLPMRIRVLFYAWLRGEVMNPEAAPGGGNAQVTTLRSAAAG